jgi:hypothetical protein
VYDTQSGTLYGIGYYLSRYREIFEILFGSSGGQGHGNGVLLRALVLGLVMLIEAAPLSCRG